jgi:Vps16, C-terminal region
MNDTNDVSEENTYNTLMEELQKVKNFNYLKLALKAIDNHKDKLGIMLLSNEPCIGAKIPLLVNKMLYSEALSMAINYGDSDIIYGVLLDHFKKEVLEKEKNEMNDRMAFIEKILRNDRAKPYLISFSRILIEICNDEKFSDCLYKYLNKINKTDSQIYEEIIYLLTSVYNTRDPTKHKLKLEEADQTIRDKFVRPILESWKELENIKNIKDTKLLKHFTVEEMFAFTSSTQVIECLMKKGSKEVEDICKALKVTGKTAYVLKLKGLIDEGSNYEAVLNFTRQIKDDIGWDILAKYAIDKKATKIAQILIDKIKDPEQKCLYLVQLNLWKDAILIMKKIKDDQLKTRVANLIIKWTHDLFNLSITKDVDEALNPPVNTH